MATDPASSWISHAAWPGPPRPTARRSKSQPCPARLRAPVGIGYVGMAEVGRARHRPSLLDRGHPPHQAGWDVGQAERSLEETLKGLAS